MIKQRFPVSGLWLQTTRGTAGCGLRINYQSWYHLLLFFFFAITGRKSKYQRRRFSKAEERENAPSLLTFKGSRTPKCTLWIWKSTVHLPDSTFCTGCSCDCCSSRMWPPIEEKMNCATAWKGGTCEVIRVKSGPAHNEIFIANADALKDIKLSCIFIFWFTGNAFFCIHFRVKRANLGLQTSAIFSALFQWWHTGSSILCTRFRLLFILLFFCSWQAPVIGYCRHISKPVGE